MTDNNAETWELTSGLADDFDCEVVDAWWGTDARYNNGQTALLFWKIDSDDEEVAGNDEFKDGGIRFSAGADWETLDGGDTVQHPSKNKFNKNSGVGTLIGRCMELGAGEVLMSRGNSQDASVWKGLRFHMKREEDEYTIQGETKKRERLLPNAFLGTSEDGGSTTAAPAAAAEEPAAPSIDLDPALRETLAKIKAETPSHNAFVDKAMELTEVQGNVTLVTAIATPDGIYKEL